MIKILPYKIGSQSAKQLARTLNVKRIVPGGSYRPRHSTLVVNWGNSNPGFVTDKILNKPEAVKIAANKLLTFQKLKAAGISIPDFTTDCGEAGRWLARDFKVVVRHKISAHSGEGIEVIRPGEYVPHAPLYTKYFRKEEEYRVHVFNGKVIDFATKKKRRYGGDVNPLIRNHSNGWVFCREGCHCPDFVREASIKSVKALGLDFGAVDIAVRDGRYCIFEINSAPGLEGSTLYSYVRAIKEYAQVSNRRHSSYY